MDTIIKNSNLKIKNITIFEPSNTFRCQILDYSDNSIESNFLRFAINKISKEKLESNRFLVYLGEELRDSYQLTMKREPCCLLFNVIDNQEDKIIIGEFHILDNSPGRILLAIIKDFSMVKNLVERYLDMSSEFSLDFTPSLICPKIKHMNFIFDL